MFTGSCVALVTPMTEEGLDIEALDNLIEWHIEQKTDAIVFLGTTGESATLSAQEKITVLKNAVSKTKGRVPVIAGTGTNSTQSTIELTKKAAKLGVDACLLVAPYYNLPTQEGIYQHFMAIADQVEIPQIIYNVPGRTVTNITPETVQRLMEHHNIIGIKDATGDLEIGKQLIQASQEQQFSIYSGDDATAAELMRLGAMGVISVVANIAPQQVHRLCHLIKERQNAIIIEQSLKPLNKALFIEANPIPVKWALTKMNKIKPTIRLPLTTLQTNNQHLVLKAMEVANIIKI